MIVQKKTGLFLLDNYANEEIRQDTDLVEETFNPLLIWFTTIFFGKQTALVYYLFYYNWFAIFDS